MTGLACRLLGGRGRRRAISGLTGGHAHLQGCLTRGVQAWGRPAAQGHQRLCRGCSGVAAAGCLPHPRMPPTLADARTPQSLQLPLRSRQRVAGAESESLGEVIVLMESGYKQRKVRPRWRLDAPRQGSGEGRGVRLRAHSALSSGLRQRWARPSYPATAVAPARAGLRHRIDVHRPHASGSPCARLLLCSAGKGAQGTAATAREGAHA